MVMMTSNKRRQISLASILTISTYVHQSNSFTIPLPSSPIRSAAVNIGGARASCGSKTQLFAASPNNDENNFGSVGFMGGMATFLLGLGTAAQIAFADPTAPQILNAVSNDLAMVESTTIATKSVSSPSSVLLSIGGQSYDTLDFSLPSYSEATKTGDATRSSADIDSKSEPPSFKNPFGDLKLPVPNVEEDATAKKTEADKKAAEEISAADKAKKAAEEKAAADAKSAADKEAKAKAAEEAKAKAEADKAKAAAEKEATEKAKEARKAAEKAKQEEAVARARKVAEEEKAKKESEKSTAGDYVDVKASPSPASPPAFKAPDFSVPDIKIPEFKAPTFSTPDIKTPDLKIPDFKAPSFSIPKLDIPAAPKLNVPSAPPKFATSPPSFGGSSDTSPAEDSSPLESQEVRDEKAREAKTEFKRLDSEAKAIEKQAKEARQVANSAKKVAKGAKGEACQTRFGGKVLCVRPFGVGY